MNAEKIKKLSKKQFFSSPKEQTQIKKLKAIKIFLFQKEKKSLLPKRKSSCERKPKFDRYFCGVLQNGTPFPQREPSSILKNILFFGKIGRQNFLACFTIQIRAKGSNL